MPERIQSGEEHLEEMVAYLDGELSPEASLRVEQRLAADENYRRRLQRLDRAWNALDELPLTTVDDRFSRTTMTMVVDAAAHDLQAKTVALPVERRQRRWTAALAAVAAAALGFLVIQLVWRNPNGPLLADLPIIDNIDLYSQVGDVDFLQRLHADLPPELAALADDSAETTARVQRFQTIADPAQRDRWIQDLSDEDRTNLRSRFNRFRNLSPEQQRRLRQLHAEIESSPDAAALQRTMFVYQQWLGGLPPARQFELRDLPPDLRAETVKDWAARLRDDSLLTLTDDELKSLFQRIRAPLNALRTPPGRNDARPSARGGRDRRDGPFSQPLSVFRNQLSEHFNPGPSDQRTFYRAVVAALPERSRQPFEQLSRRDQVDRFLVWMRQYAALVGEISQEDLERFFAEELDVDARTELLKLPPGQMEQALRWQYRRQGDADFAGGGWWNGRNRSWLDAPRRGPGPGPGGPPPGPPRPNGPAPDGDRPRGPGFGGPGEFGPPPDDFGPRRQRPFGPRREPRAPGDDRPFRPPLDEPPAFDRPPN